MSRLPLAVALLVGLAPLSAEAQPAGDRIGPQAAPAPLPAYPRPEAALPVPADPGPGAMAPDPGSGLTDIRVSSDETHGAARPPKGWAPPQEPGADLRLAYQPGQDLDAAWVRAQFALNGLSGAGGGVGRALALVQLVNRAFLGAGFINSGLIARPSSPGVLDLWLVYGGLAPSGDTAAFHVEWPAGSRQGLTSSYVRDRLPSAFARPLSAVDLERDFRLLAEDPAVRTLNADLRPGRRPGDASLGVTVYPQDRYDLYMSGANSRSPSVGGERGALGGSMRNALAAGDLLAGELGVTKGLEDAALSYAIPLTPRTTLSARAALNNAAVVSAPLNALDIKARDRVVEVGANRKLFETPLLPAAEPGRWRPAQTLTAGLLVTHRTARTSLLGAPFSFSAGSVDGRSRYTALRVTGDYVLRNVSQVFAVSVTASRGLTGSGSDIAGLPAPKPHFDAVLAQVNYARRLSAKGLELRARVTGQTANSVLYSGERFSAGGQTTVRGYRENLLLADKGVAGSLELGQPINLSPGEGAGRRFDWGAFSVTGFVDGASLRNHLAPQPQSPIYSIGASLAWVPSDALSAQVTYGEALERAQLPGKRDIQDRGLYAGFTLHPLRLYR